MSNTKGFATFGYGVDEPREKTAEENIVKSIADRLNWELNWDSPSGYTSTEYVRPWDREDWGANDVVITPPRNPGGYVPPSKPGIHEGRIHYNYMPTEKEQWRISDENKRRQALAVGNDWREARLPREEREVIYIPTDKEKNRERDWGESRPDEAYIQIEGPGNPSWERRNPREWKYTHRGGNRKPSLRDTLMRDMGSNRGLSSDRDRMSMLTGRW